eukprot:2100161-Rhodomonas_salina.2
MTCPAELSWAETCCFETPAPSGGSSKKLRIVDEPLSWDDAQSWCTEKSGRLAVVGIAEEEALHMLAGIAPPDGAWVGLWQDGSVWKFEGGDTVKHSPPDALWAVGEPKSANEAAFVTPSGSTGNVYTAKVRPTRPDLNPDSSPQALSLKPRATLCMCVRA